jgi:hypothetical protein
MVEAMVNIVEYSIVEGTEIIDYIRGHGEYSRGHGEYSII